MTGVLKCLLPFPCAVFQTSHVFLTMAIGNFYLHPQDDKQYCLFLNYICVRYVLIEYGRSPAAIVGSNPTGSMDICLL